MFITLWSPYPWKYTMIRLFSKKVCSYLLIFQKILTNPKHTEKKLGYQFLHSFVGTGLLTSSGDKWFNRRKLLTASFHFNILKEFHTIVTQQTETLLKEIRNNEVNKSNGTNLDKLISRFTLNIICGKSHSYT